MPEPFVIVHVRDQRLKSEIETVAESTLTGRTEGWTVMVIEPQSASDPYPDVLPRKWWLLRYNYTLARAPKPAPNQGSPSKSHPFRGCAEPPASDLCEMALP